MSILTPFSPKAETGDNHLSFIDKKDKRMVVLNLSCIQANLDIPKPGFCAFIP